MQLSYARLTQLRDWPFAEPLYIYSLSFLMNYMPGVAHKHKHFFHMFIAAKCGFFELNEPALTY